MDNNQPIADNQDNMPHEDRIVQPSVPINQSNSSVDTHTVAPDTSTFHQSPNRSLSESNLKSEEATSSPLNPIAVVRVLSTRGIEYVFLTFALVIASISLGAVIISLINGHYDFNVLAYPTAALLVSVPIFALFFLRLKKAENLNPSLVLDPSKRRSTQFIQIYTYIICFLTLIGIVSEIFAKMAGNYAGSIVKLILDGLVILIIAGGILFYYWRSEHKVK